MDPMLSAEVCKVLLRSAGSVQVRIGLVSLGEVCRSLLKSVEVCSGVLRSARVCRSL